MFESLLVPLDGSEFGEHALRYATAVARRGDSSLRLAHVHFSPPREDLLGPTPYQYEGVDLSEYEARDREEERSYLDQVARECGFGDRDCVQTIMLEGDVIDSLEEQARSLGSDLVVMSTHGRTGASRAWLGSVADALVRHLETPVLLIRPDEDQPPSDREPRLSRILVPLDGSELSEAILPPTRKLARLFDSAITLTTMVSPDVVVGARAYPVPAGRLSERIEESRRYLEGVAEGLRAQGFDVDVRVREATSPAQGILDVAESEESDLTAMATHGYGGVRRAVLGSVTDKVVRGSRTPVLLLRPAAKS